MTANKIITKIIDEEIKKAEITLAYYVKNKDEERIAYWYGYLNGMKEIKYLIPYNLT